jgi:hypothetical protein
MNRPNRFFVLPGILIGLISMLGPSSNANAAAGRIQAGAKDVDVSEGLRLGEIRPLAGTPYAIVAIEYPKSWSSPVFVIRANEKEVVSRRSGGGFTAKANSADYLVSFGEGELKNLSVLAAVNGNHFEAKTSWLWNPPAIAMLLDHAGENEAFFEKTRLRFFVSQVNDVRIIFNGREMAVKPDDETGKGGSILNVAPEWIAGLNTIIVAGKTKDGKELKREYSFADLSGGRIMQGEEVNLTYGYRGSRSGPFFSLDARGDAITLGEETEKTIFTLDADGWLIRKDWLLKKIVGAKPGEARLQIHEKKHFTLPEELIKEYILRVIPKVD